MVMIWRQLRPVVHDLLRPSAGVPFALLLHQVLARWATEWRQWQPDKVSFLDSRRGLSVWINTTSIQVQRLLVTEGVRKIAVVAQEALANHGATAAI
jgi:hypothetical protein